LHQLIGRARPDLQAPIAAPARHGRRIRVVFVSSFFRQCTVGNYFRSWVESLDADRFERIVMHTGWQLDEFATALASRCDRVVLARGGALQVAAAIRAEQADILIYPEIGMGAMNYLLANMRLAPVQCAAWGHPVTTGSSEIDVYFSCEAMEPAGVAAHYRERLLLPGIGTTYAQPAAVPWVVRRWACRPTATSASAHSRCSRFIPTTTAFTLT
jgi:CRISPR-associated protein Csy1